MTETIELPGLLCHCADGPGHTPGDRGCPTVAAGHAPPEATPAALYRTLGRVAPTADARAGWRRQAGLAREIEQIHKRLRAGERAYYRSLRVVRAGARWGVEHVPSGELLVHGYTSQDAARDARDALLRTDAAWTGTVLTTTMRGAVFRQLCASHLRSGLGAA